MWGSEDFPRELVGPVGSDVFLGRVFCFVLFHFKFKAGAQDLKTQSGASPSNSANKIPP